MYLGFFLRSVTMSYQKEIWYLSSTIITITERYYFYAAWLTIGRRIKPSVFRQKMEPNLKAHTYISNQQVLGHKALAVRAYWHGPALEPHPPTHHTGLPLSWLSLMAV